MDAVPRIKAHAVSTDDAAASVPDDYIERVVRSRKQASNEQAPISFKAKAFSSRRTTFVIGATRK